VMPVATEWRDEVHYWGAVVVYEGSTYQARKDTGTAPGSPDWICLSRAGADAHELHFCGAHKADDGGNSSVASAARRSLGRSFGRSGGHHKDSNCLCMFMAPNSAAKQDDEQWRDAWEDLRGWSYETSWKERGEGSSRGC
jgi:hypothetical protein